jgi:hypothetical protein
MFLKRANSTKTMTTPTRDAEPFVYGVMKLNKRGVFQQRTLVFDLSAKVILHKKGDKVKKSLPFTSISNPAYKKDESNPRHLTVFLNLKEFPCESHFGSHAHRLEYFTWCPEEREELCAIFEKISHGLSINLTWVHPCQAHLRA